MDSSTIQHRFEWNNKREIIKEQQLLFAKSLESDCIVISAQGNRHQAHQVVLSSSSDFFRKILSELPSQSEPAIIHIPDIDTSILEAILRFIYTGETSITSNYLTNLLEFCHLLGIKGCIANGFTLLNQLGNEEGQNELHEIQQQRLYYSSSESCSSEEYLEVSHTESVNGDDGATEPDYLEEYLDDEALVDIKHEAIYIENSEYDNSSEFISFEIENTLDDISSASTNDNTDTQVTRNVGRQSARSTSSQIEKALNEVNNGKTIHRLSVEYNLPRSTLYHRFRNNANLKQNYRLERKSALDNAVRAVLHERLSLKTAADRYKVPKTAIWREVRKSEQYQPSTKEITMERQNAQREILSGHSLTSISAKYGIPLTTLHRDKKKLSIEGKLPESFRVKDRTENSEYGQRLEMALEKCRNGMSQYQAAKLFNIPKATMWRYANALKKSAEKVKVNRSQTNK